MPMYVFMAGVGSPFIACGDFKSDEEALNEASSFPFVRWRGGFQIGVRRIEKIGVGLIFYDPNPKGLYQDHPAIGNPNHPTRTLDHK